jgi:hypothetical protein
MKTVSVPEAMLKFIRQHLVHYGRAEFSVRDIDNLLSAAPVAQGEQSVGAEVSAMESALWQLIKLKDIKEQMEKGKASDYLHGVYNAEKEASWQRAREAAIKYTEKVSALTHPQQPAEETAAHFDGRHITRSDSQESPAVGRRKKGK